MQLVDWLTPWWNWWAAFTGLFDWDAIGAVATAAAVIIALDQATKSERLARRRHLLTIDRLLSYFEPIAESFSYDDTGYLDAISLETLLASDAFRRAREGVGRMDPMAIGETGLGLSQDYLLDVIKWVELGAERSIRADDGKGPPTFTWLPDLDLIFRELFVAREQLKHGPTLGRLLVGLRPGRYPTDVRLTTPNHIVL